MMNTKQLGRLILRLILWYMIVAMLCAAIDVLKPGKYTFLTTALPELILVFEALISAKRLKIPLPQIKRPQLKTILLITVTAALFYILQIAVGLPMERFNAETKELEIQVLQTMPAVPMILVLSIITPAAEEFVFRGFIFEGYRKHLPYIEAAALSAVIFAAFHMNIAELPYTFLLGMVSAAVLEITGNLFYSILLHFLVNMAGSLILLVPKLRIMDQSLRHAAVLYFTKQPGYRDFPEKYALIVILAVLSLIGLLFLDKMFRVKEPLLQQMHRQRPKILTASVWISILLLLTVMTLTYNVNFT